MKPNSPLYSSEYIEYLVRVTKPSVDGTLLSIISQNHSTPVPLSLVVIIFRAPSVNEIALEKKKIISIYRNRISTYFSPRSKTNVSIRCWMKRIPIPVYSINYTRCYFNAIHEKLCSIFILIDFQKYRNIDRNLLRKLQHHIEYSLTIDVSLKESRFVSSHNNLLESIFIAFLCKPPLTTKQG